MLDDDRTVHPHVRDAVVLALWIPPILILIAIGLAAVGLAWQIVQGRPVPLGDVGDAVPPSLLVSGAVVAVGYLYLMVANETFGESTVEAATEQAEDLQESSDGD